MLEIRYFTTMRKVLLIVILGALAHASKVTVDSSKCGSNYTFGYYGSVTFTVNYDGGPLPENCTFLFHYHTGVHLVAGEVCFLTKPFSGKTDKMPIVQYHRKSVSSVADETRRGYKEGTEWCDTEEKLYIVFISAPNAQPGDVEIEIGVRFVRGAPASSRQPPPRPIIDRDFIETPTQKPTNDGDLSPKDEEFIVKSALRFGWIALFPLLFAVGGCIRCYRYCRARRCSAEQHFATDEAGICNPMAEHAAYQPGTDNLTQSQQQAYAWNQPADTGDILLTNTPSGPPPSNSQVANNGRATEETLIQL